MWRGHRANRQCHQPVSGRRRHAPLESPRPTVGVPHETLSEIVVACIVPHEGARLEETKVRDYLKERLASFKVPRAILFFREEDFAVTGSEKVKTGMLRELAGQRLAGGGRIV